MDDMEEHMSGFYTRIKAYREKLNMSQKNLAEKAGVRRETVVRLEKGQYNPSLKLAVDIAGELQAEVEDIFVFADSGETAAKIFQRRDAHMLEEDPKDLYDQAFQEGFETGVTESAVKMLATLVGAAKIYMEGNLAKEKWVAEQKIIMVSMGFPKEGWDDICAFIEKYPELSPIALARMIIRESEYRYI